MAKKYAITFVEVAQPQSGLLTKFGGQPDWLTGPQWPISRATGEPMRFLGQIALDAELFGPLAGRMAYLFISDGITFVDNTWDAEGGENALIIQPGTTAGPTQPMAVGPTLFKMVDNLLTHRRDPVAAEYAVVQTPGDDSDEADLAEYPGTDIENKIGGRPVFLQGEEWPAGGPWKLLLQVDSAAVPFDVNFGDAGVGYAFISADGKVGRFLWQCA